MAYLQLIGLTKRFGGTSVIEGVDLEAQAGEFLVLVGASGCGKSTTLRMIAGLDAPSAGRIVIDGRDVTYASPADRDIAMVFQNYALYPHMDVAQNMSFALELAGRPRAEISQRVADAARILEIEHLLKRRPKELSGGQRQRVAMGRAIVREPKVFLFDEPLSNLDAKLRGQVRVEIALLHQRMRKTTVYVTHDQIEAMTLADRIVVMDGGRIQQVGTPDEVFNRPANRFVAGFIGSPTMNFIPARLPSAGGDEVVIGLRPQALRLQSEGGTGSGAGPTITPEAVTLSMQVAVAEYLGTETVLSGHLAGDAQVRLTVCLPGRQTALVGTVIPLAAPASALYLFAPGSHGLSLPVAGSFHA